MISTPSAISIRNEFKNPTIAVAVFSSQNVMRQCFQMTHISQFVKSNHPKLIDIKSAWNDIEPPRLVVQNFITELISLLNFKDENTMNAAQVKECSLLMLREAWDMNIAELCEFFNRVKSAMYGGFFGSIDSNKIMEDFRLYRKDLESCRMAVKRTLEADKRRREDEERRSRPYIPPEKSVDEIIADWEEETEDMQPQPIMSTYFKRIGVL